MTKMTNRKTCYVCGKRCPHLLETHHIVPRRHGGSNRSSNLVDLCPTCHRALEKIYDKSFYNTLKKKFSNKPDKTVVDELETSNKSDVADRAWDIIRWIESDHIDVKNDNPYGVPKDVACKEIKDRLEGVHSIEEAEVCIDELRTRGELYEPKQEVFRIP